ncbi:hypothetical protein F5Y14DRAFT_182159 [Nemania sp. NC0429]|nr:hypothetical protein F5Y14DRAFT_182159 [Nemania sp. NC0429]
MRSISHTRQPDDGFDVFRLEKYEPMRVSAALLLTCRRAYLETHSLPLLRIEQCFYCYRDPSSGDLGSSPTDVSSFITDLYSNPAPVPGLRQADLVRSVRLFPRQSWLEDSFPSFVSTSIWFANIEHLRITLRRSDWRDWVSYTTPRINPFRGSCKHSHTASLMQSDMSTEGGNVEFARGAWGNAFSHMSKLKTLTIDFETCENKREWMEAVVAWALKWRFPLTNGQHLSSCGQPASKMSWQAILRGWVDRCESCGHYGQVNYPDGACLRCDKPHRLFLTRRRPQFFIWTCLWKRVRDMD